MSDQITIVNQVVKEIKKGKDDIGEYGHWTLYKMKFAQSDKTFSWFAGDDERVPAVGENLLVVKYVEDNKGKYTYYTIKKMEFDPASQSSAQRLSEPTYHPINSPGDNGLKEISIFTAYAKDLFVAKMQHDKTIQEMPISEICKQAVLCGKAMFNLAIGKTKTQKPATPPAQPKPTAPAPPAPPTPSKEAEPPLFDDDGAPLPNDDDLPF